MTVQVNESNIYKKLAVARVRFQELNVKQSGKNTFANYSYFELSDILPAVNKLGNELGFTCLVSFTSDMAYLVVVNTDNPTDKVEFASPMSTANLKGCHEVQNLGAVETYIKRYLYQNAFEIVEHDALNSTHNPNDTTHKQVTPKPTSIPEIERKFMSEIRACKTLDDLESTGNKIAERYPNKTAPESVKSEYRLRQRELTPELSS